ncbi:cellulose synthase-like protein E6 [Aristolochia californica]|uniref:cellulose synthase-like protein E6 n=1 Tax=Aristolochia californica TaxID=171875 RepID=UPI0035DF0404
MGREDGSAPLFETEEFKWRTAYRLYALSVFVGICLIWFYRWNHIPETGERWVWYGLFGAEIFLGLYWILNQSVRWRPVLRYTFKERLSQRYETELPYVDIFVCTADPTIEPPLLVVNTVLSVMAYDYPSEKIAVYLSDDGGSDLTFYALLEASRYAKHWIPFCKKFNVEPRSPGAYFSSPFDPPASDSFVEEWQAVKKLYQEMESRVEATTKSGKISKEIKAEHEGFSEWNGDVTARNHQTILKILLDGSNPQNADVDGYPLPTLVYLAREKRPKHPHHFKAGAMNALLRVSSESSNGQIILNVDCDMYSNNSQAVRDALCFFMDEENGHEVAYVQSPQTFNNTTRNNFYHNELIVINGIEHPGVDGFGGPLYIGTGCFHRRRSLCGKQYSKGYKEEWRKSSAKKDESIRELEERVKGLASCTAEENTQWGKEMGLRYGCAVEDVVTGLSIQRNGWKSVYFNPPRRSFLGIGPITLEQALVQHKRWSEGNLHIVLSKYSPLFRWDGKIDIGHRMAYSIYNLWACTSIPTLYYVVVPSLCLYTGTAVFPKMSSPWFIPFVYVIVANHISGVFESFWSGQTLKGWWNVLRMIIFRRTTSYLFGFVDAFLKLSGFSKSSFVVTAKVADGEVCRRYEQEIMEFGSTSPMFVIISTLALLNLISLGGGLKTVLASSEFMAFDALGLQFLLCGVLILINIPVYEALFFRSDKGCLPSAVTLKSLVLAVLACSLGPVLVTKSIGTPSNT